ncbi:putative ankyrin repeat protein [Smittium mucronatum]|uniref:Putative ankyrin repeat protein n=1 Tax=Smittium mucronatum TaxID=133383 RepID=A0A1R0H1F5_9FUNG|nr:putative ankyrin repeat protein [Smittium mucronatum]
MENGFEKTLSVLLNTSILEQIPTEIYVNNVIVETFRFILSPIVKINDYKDESFLVMAQEGYDRVLNLLMHAHKIVHSIEKHKLDPGWFLDRKKSFVIHHKFEIGDLTEGEEPKTSGEDGIPPKILISSLENSVINGKIRFTKLILDEVLFYEYEYSKVLDLAIKSDELEMVELVSSYCDITEIKSKGLEIALNNGNVDICKYLISQGFQLENNISSKLIVASERGSLEFAKYLVDMGADVHGGDILE